MQQANRVSRIPDHFVPPLQDAVEAYEAASGGSLSAPHSFGEDLWSTRPEKCLEREQDMKHKFDPKVVLSRAVNGDYVICFKKPCFITYG